MANEAFILFSSLSHDVTNKINTAHQFIINSHLPLPKLQEVLKTHQASMAIFAASISFYKTLTLGSLVVTVISGLAVGSSNSRDQAPFISLAIIAGIVFVVSGIMWMIKSSNYSDHQYWSNCYTQLIDIKRLPAEG